MVNVEITDYYYEKSTGSYLKNGVKANRIPRGSVAGGRGTFVMSGDPPKMNIRVSIYSSILDQKVTDRFDMYPVIKKYGDRRRVTERYCADIFTKICSKKIDTSKLEDPKSMSMSDLRPIINFVNKELIKLVIEAVEY